LGLLCSLGSHITESFSSYKAKKIKTPVLDFNIIMYISVKIIKIRWKLLALCLSLAFSHTCFPDLKSDLD